MVIEYVATCLFGLESLLGEEIEKLGYKRTETMDGRVSFTGDENAVAVCSINLRFAERLYIKIGEFEAYTFDELFEIIKNELYVNEAVADSQFKHKKLAEYLERALYVCPCCGLSTFESHNDVVKCKKCAH